MSKFYKIKKIYPYKGGKIFMTTSNENLELEKDDKFIYEGQKYIMLNNSDYEEYEDIIDKIEDSKFTKILKIIKESIPGL